MTPMRWTATDNAAMEFCTCAFIGLEDVLNPAKRRHLVM